MPPLVAALPLILGGLGAGELGLGIYNDVKGSPKAPAPTPVTTIPGSPLDIVGGGAASAGGPGPSELPASSVLNQITGAGTPGGAAGAGAGATGGGGAKSAAPPASIGGGSAGVGGATDFNALPWMQNMTPSAASPGTPAAGL